MTENSKEVDELASSLKNVFKYIGDDPEREGLKETPARMIKSWGEMFCGYQQDPYSLVKCFEEGTCDEMVILKDFEFSSFCEHHFLPFIGTASIGYLPNKKVIGVSKLARIFDCFARRLQIQERLTSQVANLLEETIEPFGVIVVVQAKHLCISQRGVRKKEGAMITSAIRGRFKEQPVRNEFLQLIK